MVFGVVDVWLVLIRHTGKAERDEKVLKVDIKSVGVIRFDSHVPVST